MSQTWTHSESEALIDQYEKQKFLYDPNDPYYSNDYIRIMTLRIIVQNLADKRIKQTSIDNVALHIGYLRDCFFNDCKRGANNPPEFEKLLFLKKYMQPNGAIRTCECQPMLEPSKDQINVSSELSNQDIQESEDVQPKEKNEIKSNQNFEIEKNEREQLDEKHLELKKNISILLTNSKMKTKQSTQDEDKNHDDIIQDRETSNKRESGSRILDKINGNFKSESDAENSYYHNKNDKGEQSKNDNVLNLLVNSVQALAKRIDEEENEHEIFKKYVEGEFSAIKSDKLLKKCKREICRVIFHFQELDEECEENSSWDYDKNIFLNCIMF